MSGGLRYLRGERLRACLSQAELAERSGVTKWTIVQIEAGRVRPQPRTVRKLAEALGMMPSQLGWER